MNRELTGESRPISSNQQGLHPNLARVVRRHLGSRFRRPVARHSEVAYATLAEQLAADARPLILDSFCGTGLSTALLAARHPDCLVVGVDQSAHRLQKHVTGPADNYLLLRAQAEDIWQLLLRDGRQLQQHYLLYPNPWPKSKHLQRRIHGHGSFDWLLRLGGSVEVRSNWQLYVEEFGLAMHLAGRRGVVSLVPEAPPLTLFEEKYRRSGHSLWRFVFRATVTSQGL